MTEEIGGEIVLWDCFVAPRACPWRLSRLRRDRLRNDGGGEDRLQL